jgi:cytidyltransferase-like protein
LNEALARVGMFGGAFDPPHRAHVALARAAIEQLKLDRLCVMPTGQAWHKDRTLTSAEHRLALTRLAFDGVPNVEVDDRELRRAGPTYSVDTLRELHDEHPVAQLYLLMGDDQAAGFTHWMAWQEIARMAVLCVAGRGPGSAWPRCARCRACASRRCNGHRCPRAPPRSGPAWRRGRTSPIWLSQRLPVILNPTTFTNPPDDD